MQSAASSRLRNVTTVVGGNGDGFSGDGGPAINAKLDFPWMAVEAADGSLYVLDQGNNRIRRIDPNGVISTVAGNGVGGFSGDGGPATAAQIFFPEGIALGPDGSLYIADTFNHRVRKVTPDGIIRTIAGTGVAGFSGDGGAALQAKLDQPEGVAVAPNGDVYIADSANDRIRFLTTDGTIRTVAGNGVFVPGPGNAVNGMRALDVSLEYPERLAIGPDGNLYILDWFHRRVYRVGFDGLLTIVTGIGTFGYSGDGGPATAAQIADPRDIFVAKDSSVYLADASFFVRRISPDGIISTIMKAENFGSPIEKNRVYDVGSIWLSQDGSSLYVADAFGQIVKISPPRQGLGLGDQFIASEDGRETYHFNSEGRHLRTLDTLTGAVHYQFAYTSEGFLTTVTDLDGKVTTIERDANGNATAIVAPGGQRTTLIMEANGYLASVANPQNETVLFSYSAEGLMATMKDPAGNTHVFTHDALGRLSRDEDPASGFKTLARTEQSNGWTVSVTSGLGRTNSYQVDNLLTGDKQRTFTDPNGLIARFATSLPAAGSDSVRTYTVPDGTITTQVLTQDPRFGMQSPLMKSLTVQTPLGVTSTTTQTRTVTLANPVDPFSMTSLTDTVQINGRQYQSVFTQTAKTLTTTTPVGRTSNVTLDAKGRVVQEQVTGLEAVAYTYDSLGRLSTITQGSGASARTSTLTYNSKNELTSIQDPLLRNVGFAYDLAGRITTQTLPDTRVIGYAYDPNSNVTSITPPGKPQHQFQYTPVDLESNYNPPDAGFAPRHTQYAYNVDRQLTTVTRPDGQIIQLGYEPTGGRLSTLTLPGNQVTTYAYGATTGTLSSITAPGSTLSYTYDGSLLKQTTWAGTVAGSVSRNYDNNFRVTSQSVNGTNTINFGYDNDSLLTSAGSLSFARSAQHGLITGTTLATITDSRTYSTFGELSSYTANASGSPVFNTTFTRDKLGRITQKVETISGTTTTFDYAYDTAGRLQEVKTNGTVTATYSYDTNGNRSSVVTPGGTTSGTYDVQDRLTAYGTATYTYSNNGELQSKTVSGQTTSYVYDVLGNLKLVSLPTGVSIEYVVDGQNRRIGKKVNGTLTTGWLYQNQLNPVAELDGTGAVVARFVYGTKANVPDYMIKGGVTYRIVSDHLGSSRLVINTADGSVAQRIDYDEFGNVTQDTAPGFQPFGFAGGLYDQQTGLTRFGARDYDAVTGRWTAKDPILFATAETTNLYGYVRNNPTNRTDSAGLGQISFRVCTALNIGKQAYDFASDLNLLDESTRLTREMLARVDSEISSCPSKDVERLVELKNIRDRLGLQLDQLLMNHAADVTKLGLYQVAEGMAWEGLCALALVPQLP